MTTSWVPVTADSDFLVQNLPYGIFSRAGEPARAGVAIGDQVLDLAAAGHAGLLDDAAEPFWFDQPSLNAFMAAGPDAWERARGRLTDLLTDEARRERTEPHLIPQAEVALHLPWELGDYVDFYSSREHAENLGRMFRPDSPPLLPNWRHVPVAYHGRAGTVVVSGTPVVRPAGQRRGDDGPIFGPSTRLDIEAEVGFVVGAPTPLGRAVSVDDVWKHVFGVVLVNDWSARDIQAWEYQPLGPFLGKSFATSVSPWVVPLTALAPARVPPPAQDPEPLPYLRGSELWGLDMTLSVRLNGHEVARPPFAGMYWSPAQQLAHMTVNGAALRPGDLFASGTVSGPERAQRGSLIELAWNGEDPIKLPDGTTRVFLEDGDTVSVTATAPGADGTRIGFGEVAGTVAAAAIMSR